MGGGGPGRDRGASGGGSLTLTLPAASPSRPLGWGAPVGARAAARRERVGRVCVGVSVYARTFVRPRDPLPRRFARDSGCEI